MYLVVEKAEITTSSPSVFTSLTSLPFTLLAAAARSERREGEDSVLGLVITLPQ